MKDYDAAAVLEVVEQLVAELGLEAVPAEIDVDGAVLLLNEEIYGDKTDGDKKEGANTPVYCEADPVVDAVGYEDAPGMEPVTEQVH